MASSELDEDGIAPQDDPNRIVVREEEFVKLARTPAIRAALRDSRLQRILLRIDGAEDREGTLRRAMNNPEFRSFINDMLLTMGMARKLPNGEVEFIK